ncbi:transcriptional regulator [Marinovum sp.]|uniref:transcriptional regulator n=1 Tax=Marinovum sp. TaxID=2024839 RepID=UPI002B2660FD|nr:transcriptional regulator [Marinovum sp.]
MPEEYYDKQDWLQRQVDSNLMRIYRQPCESKLPDRMEQLLEKLREKEAARN